MSNPWHGEIAALSRLHLIRDNMGVVGTGRGAEREVVRGRGRGKRRAEEMGGRGTGWWE